jgi:hypothetical protein
MFGAARMLTTIGLTSLCWGCSASPKEAAAPPVAQAPVYGADVARAETDSLLDAPRHDDLDSTKRYGEVRPRLSRVITLGEVDFPRADPLPAATGSASAAPQVVVINNNTVQQSTYVSRARADSCETSPSTLRPFRARSSRTSRTSDRGSPVPPGSTLPPVGGDWPNVAENQRRNFPRR